MLCVLIILVNNMQEPRAKKSLGQNFLQDKNIAGKIVDAVRIEQGDFVLEIGPGPGMLTNFLTSKQPRKLFLVEKDYYWAETRQKALAAAGQSGGVILTDALTMPWARFDFPCKIVGNLPYNVASPLMWDIVSLCSGLQRAVFMVQKEVALRIVAASDTSAYGALSAWLQCYTTPIYEFTVPPQVFKPAPKVHSAVVSFKPLPVAELPQKPDKLSMLLKIMFQKRRKQLGGIFKGAGLSHELLEQSGISLFARPENLSPQQMKKISENL